MKYIAVIIVAFLVVACGGKSRDYRIDYTEFHGEWISSCFSYRFNNELSVNESYWVRERLVVDEDEAVSLRSVYADSECENFTLDVILPSRGGKHTKVTNITTKDGYLSLRFSFDDKEDVILSSIDGVIYSVFPIYDADSISSELVVNFDWHYSKI